MSERGCGKRRGGRGRGRGAGHSVDQARTTTKNMISTAAMGGKKAETCGARVDHGHPTTKTTPATAAAAETSVAAPGNKARAGAGAGAGSRKKAGGSKHASTSRANANGSHGNGNGNGSSSVARTQPAIRRGGKRVSATTATHPSTSASSTNHGSGGAAATSHGDGGAVGTLDKKGTGRGKQPARQSPHPQNGTRKQCTPSSFNSTSAHDDAAGCRPQQKGLPRTLAKPAATTPKHLVAGRGRGARGGRGRGRGKSLTALAAFRRPGDGPGDGPGDAAAPTRGVHGHVTHTGADSTAVRFGGPHRRGCQAAVPPCGPTKMGSDSGRGTEIAGGGLAGAGSSGSSLLPAGWIADPLGEVAQTVGINLATSENSGEIGQMAGIAKALAAKGLCRWVHAHVCIGVTVQMGIAAPGFACVCACAHACVRSCTRIQVCTGVCRCVPSHVRCPGSLLSAEGVC